MASFSEPEAPLPEEEEEPFTFVSRKKTGHKQPQALPVTNKIAAHKSPTPMADKVSQEPTTHLPGWSKRPTKVKKNSQRAKMMGSRGAEPEERTLEWGINIMEERKATLKQSKFYLAFRELVLSTLCPALALKGIPIEAKKEVHDSAGDASNSVSEGEQAPTTATGAPATHLAKTEITTPSCPSSLFTDIVCYGIGSMEESRNSQFQLALALLLKEILNISGTISIFDPIMTEFDQSLAEHLGLTVLKVNDQAKQSIQARTLLYMPHCPKGLYSHVLESNWTRAQLDKLVILGNRFTMYDESPSFRQLAKQAPFILPALSIATVSLLPLIKFDDCTIFNDLALHLFPPDRVLPPVDLEGREVDPELL